LNRTGLFIALGLAVLAGLLFGIFPQLDLTLARVFYNEETRQFMFGTLGWAEYVRRAAMWIAWAFVVPSVVALIVKLFRPHQPLLVSGRTIIFLFTTIFLTAGLLPNVILKDHWGRPRPVATNEFSGPHAFKPWWDPRGTNPRNGSFFSGEAATAFWTYAPAALAPPSIRPLAYVAATIFGLTTGIFRMAFGGHYASDVIAAGLAAFLVAWLVHGFVYRWRRLRLSDEQIDQAITRAIVPLRLLLALTLLTALRLIALNFSVVDLFPDEAQYWAWSQTPAFGYFSKPPLIAWIIGAAASIGGNSEACLRAPAPLFYGGTALLTYFIARHLYGERVGVWSALCLALATGVVFSARIISTDVPLLFCWALALLAYVKLLDAPKWRWSIVLGLALGFGLLAKYAMVYFLLGGIVAAFIDPRARAALRQPAIWFALLLALMVLAPNLIWNATHHFATFRHTQGNIQGSGFQFDPLGPLRFVTSQFAVAGPILFAVFLLALTRLRKLERADRLMIAFALPPLVLVTVTSLVASANANWAAPSAISIAIVAVALLVRQSWSRLLIATVGLGLVLQITLSVADAYADRIAVPFMAKPDIYRRTMGWESMASLVRQTAQAHGAASIAADQRDVISSLLYYLRDDPWPILSWPARGVPSNQFDVDRPLTSAAVEPVLYISNRSLPQVLTGQYATIETLPPIEAVTGPGSTRRFLVFKLTGAVLRSAPD
jgi:membrane-associated phospholipid phosphatase